MALPKITFTPSPAPVEVLSVGAAAKYALTTPHLLGKLLQAGYIASLTREDLAPLRVADTVTSADGRLPLIQTAPARQLDEGWRTWVGDSPELSDEDWLRAQCGDWNRAPKVAFLDAGYALVGLGGVITGVTKVVGLLDSGDTSKARFEMQLLGRLAGDLVTARHSINPDATAEDQEFALSLLGKRYPSQQGGSVGLI